MSNLEKIIEQGNRSFTPGKWGSSEVRCADGFTMSVIAGEGAYSVPRPDRYGYLDGTPGDYPGPYRAVEVGFPTERPEPWDDWQAYAEQPDDPTGTVYGFVPVDVVRALVELHGGES